MEVEYGTLELKTLALHLPEGAADAVAVSVKGPEAEFTHAVDGDCVRIEFAEAVTLNAGDRLRAAFRWD